MEIRIDELAHRAGVPSRTIRYYTQQGLLPAPRLRGRVGYYGEEHLERLRLIKELQEKRYLPLAVIKRVLRKFEAGADLEAMLAPLDIVFAPRWQNGRRELTRTELAIEAGVGEDVVEAAEEMGFLFPVSRGGECRYTEEDIQMLEVTDEWLRLGIPRQLGRLYRESFQEISREQVQAFNDRVVLPLATQGLPPEELRRSLLDGYREMARTFTRVAGLLHRQLLQQAVESHAAAEDGPARGRDGRQA